jgi:hypothetical protein
MTTSPSAEPQRYPGRLFLALGLLVTVLGIIAYIVQLSAGRLFTPWYLPVSATLGVFLVLVSVWQKGIVLRKIALMLVLLVAIPEWFFLFGEPLPPYTGPVAVGQPFPAFATVRADGTPFTQHDLEGEQTNVLVFFRGHW